MPTRMKGAPPPALFAAPAAALPRDTRLRAASTIEWLPASSIGTDRRVNTREVDMGWVAAKSKPGEFSWDFLGTVSVSQREDGSKISVDGQHRIALLEAIGEPDAELKCEVFTGLTLAQEAALFLGLNAGRTVRPVSLFLAKVTMGDPLCTEVLQIVRDCSWDIATEQRRGVLSCVKALTRIHSTDRAKNTSGGFEPQALRDTLTVITHAWRQHEQAGHESLISGIGKLMIRDGKIIREGRYGGISGTDRLITVLEASGPDPTGMLGKARSFASTRVPPVGLPTAVAEVARQSFNYGLQSRRLPAFVS